MNPPPPTRRRFGRFLWISTLLVLAASLVLNVVLFRYARRFYARELAVRLQPVGTTNVLRSGNPAGLRVLFLGDSRAAEWPALPADRFCTLNAGLPGQTTAQIRLHTEAVLLTEKPAIVVLQAGINDLKAVGSLLDADDQIQSQCLTNLFEIVKLCRQHGARVILTLILPPGKVSLARREFFWSNKIEPVVRAVNESLIHQFTNSPDVVVLDLEKILACGRPNPKDFSDYRDTLHFKPEAYTRLQPDLIRIIDQM